MSTFVNFLKGQFIGIYMMSAMGVGIYSIYQIVLSGFSLVWFGVVLVNLPVVILISYLMMFQNVARTSTHFPVLSILGLIGSMLSVYPVIVSQRDFTLLPVYFSLGGYIGFLIYNFWYSKLGRKRNHALKVGEMLPVFKAFDINGNQFSTENVKGHPALYMFYRGNWCPLCMAQIKEIVALYQKLTDKGVQVILISPQPEKFSRSLAEKYKVDFKFLTDKNNKAAKRLGIFMPQGLPFGMQMFGYKSDTVFPTVIATDAEGCIIFSDETDNYRIRPEPSTFIKIFEGL